MTKPRLALDKIAIFRDLSEDDLLALSARCSWKTYQPKEIILGQQEDSHSVYFLIDGRVRVMAYSAAGKEVSYRDIEPGEIFGEWSAIDGGFRSARVEALDASQMAIMDAGTFMDMLNGYPSVNHALLMHLIGQLRRLSDRVFEFSTLAVRNRIHTELLRMASKKEEHDNMAVIYPSPNQGEIASRISTHREAVTRELNELERRGILEKRGRTLIIKDLNQLKSMIGEALGDIG